ncbi:MAG: nuclear transport factor 2 family protein [Pseudomonadota bacterium]
MDDPKTLEDTIRELADREAIRDCLFRYCRGIDRADESALRSAYWPDGTDQHGPYTGSASGFVDWALKQLKYAERNIHQIHNILIEFKSGGAAVESYFSAFQRQPGPDGKMIELEMKGRYLDWFVARDGEWRILNRVVVFDWVEQGPAPSQSEATRFGALTPIGSNHPTDPIYREDPV